MAKREIPLFVVDTARHHRRGECDFVCCTDRDNGFVARIDFVKNAVPEVGEDYRVETGVNEVGFKMSIIRSTGMNPQKTQVRGLLKKACEYYTEITHRLEFHGAKPTVTECIEFLEKTVRANNHRIAEAGCDVVTAKIIRNSIMYVNTTIDYLKGLLYAN